MKINFFNKKIIFGYKKHNLNHGFRILSINSSISKHIINGNQV